MKEKQIQEKRAFTKGEEIFNAVSHIAGGAIGIVILIVGIICSSLYNDGYAMAGMIIYGVSMIILYTMSAIYHFLHPTKAKKVFKVFDHCSIYLLIAGTYTPICMVALRDSGFWGWGILIAVWVLAVLGVTFNAIAMNNKVIKILSNIAYLLMGWCAVVAIVPILEVIPLAGFLWILAGGVMYTVGMVFYGLGHKKKYIHSVWHLFVLAGTIFQFFGILFYIIL